MRETVKAVREVDPSYDPRAHRNPYGPYPNLNIRDRPPSPPPVEEDDVLSPSVEAPSILPLFPHAEPDTPAVAAQARPPSPVPDAAAEDDGSLGRLISDEAVTPMHIHGEIHVAFFASQSIKQWEEITYDHGPTPHFWWRNDKVRRTEGKNASVVCIEFKCLALCWLMFLYIVWKMFQHNL